MAVKGRDTGRVWVTIGGSVLSRTVGRSRAGSYRSQRENGRCPGITFIELAVIVSIVLGLTGLGIIAYSGYRDNANMARAVADIRAIEHDIYIYEGYAANLPEGLDQLGKDLLLDPWGNPYQYYNAHKGNGNGLQRFDRLGNLLNTDFDLYSTGRDGTAAPGLDKQESSDDIVRAANGKFVGLASAF